MLGPWLMNATGIHDPLARGLALGTVSHGQGTAQAVVEGELQGAAAGIAIATTAAIVRKVTSGVSMPETNQRLNDQCTVSGNAAEGTGQFQGFGGGIEAEGAVTVLFSGGSEPTAACTGATPTPPPTTNPPATTQ